MPHQNLLSPDEVDALLAGAATERSPPPDSHRDGQGQVRTYDLLSPDRVTHQRMQTLELINERFARRLRPMFFGFLRRNVDITVNAIRIQKYAEFEHGLPDPCNLNLATMAPLRGTALFTFEPNLVFLVIDSLFGGHGRRGASGENRDFTATEQRIIRRLLGLTLECYGQSWENIHPVAPEHIRSETRARFAGIGGGNDLMVVSSFNIALGTAGGRLNICLPYAMINPIRDLLVRPLRQAASDSIDQRWTQQLAREVRSAEVELSAEFARIETTIGELIRLRVDDVLPIEVSPRITARVGGVPVLECGYGTFNGRYALRVHKVLATPPEEPPSSGSEK
uniref:flagellar motor switch protein FliM n=1 Tax=Castellaniella defragrans TaxID=75697 RepID=UPI0033407803